MSKNITRLKKHTNSYVTYLIPKRRLEWLNLFEKGQENVLKRTQSDEHWMNSNKV